MDYTNISIYVRSLKYIYICIHNIVCTCKDKIPVLHIYSIYCMQENPVINTKRIPQSYHIFKYWGF